MKGENLKQAVKDYALNNTVAECTELFKGIVSQATIYRWLNETEELVYSYTQEECLREWKKLRITPGNYSAAPANNRIVLTSQPHFFHIEKQLYKDPLIREKLIANRKKYLYKNSFNHRELLRGFKISGLHIGYSHFSPLWIKKFIEDFNITSIYDPCGGWGHRLVGATAANISYTYNDKWKQSYEGAKNIAHLINSSARIYNNDCTNFTPVEDYTCVFTCPPYYNVELYSDTGFKTIEEYKLFITNLFKCSIKPSVTTIGIVINNTFKDIIHECIPNNYTFKAEITLGSTKSISHFNKSNSTKSELLLVFNKKL